jgi:hypothetical protein
MAMLSGQRAVRPLGGAVLGAQRAARQLCGLPYRIRAPLARLVEKKKQDEKPQAKVSGGLGDGEKLETNASGAMPRAHIAARTSACACFAPSAHA